MTRLLLRTNISLSKFKPFTCCFLLYIMSLIFRIISPFYFHGYIHPDEYFQSYQPMMDFIGLKSQVPWEFTIQYQLRSWVGPIILIGLPIKLFHHIILFCSPFQNISLADFSPYTIYIIPKLFITFLSLFTDYYLYKTFIIISKNFQLKINVLHILLLHSISLPICIYGTRTFTNTLEWITFTYIFHHVTKNLLQNKFNFNRFLITISIITLFIRPTFLIFMCIPFLTIFYQSFLTKNMLKFFLIGLFSIPITLTIIIFDTFMYASNFHIAFNKLNIVQVYKHLTLTPLNFLRYNQQKNNLETHGLHPFYTHITVNSLILWGPYLLFLVYTHIIKYIFAKWLQRKKKFKNIYKIESFSIASFLFPLIVFSFIPHQEPRFLLPLTTPVFVIFAFNYHNYIKKFNISFSNLILKILFLLNLMMQFVLITFFNVYHQSGIIPSLLNFKNTMQNDAYNNSRVTLFYSHTYMAPQCLLVQTKRSYDEAIQTINLDGKLKDFAGLNSFLISSKLGSPNLTSLNHQIYLAIPASIMLQWTNDIYHLDVNSMHVFKSEKYSVTFKLVARYPRHLSCENLPQISWNKYCTLIKSRYNGEKMSLKVFLKTFLYLLNRQLYLNVYKIIL